MWNTVKNTLATIAPVLGNALGGPLGGLAMSSLMNVLGLTNPTPEELDVALKNATPEQRLALIQEQNKLVTAMAQIQLQQDQTTTQDTQDARDMVENLASNSSKLGGMVLALMLLTTIVVLAIYVQVNIWAFYILRGS